MGGSPHIIGLKSTLGEVWSWGTNAGGQLGDGTIIDRSSPVSVVGAHSFDIIFTGGSWSMALKAVDGACWMWGLGTAGQLGQGSSAVSRSSPVSVVGAHSFYKIAIGYSHSLALKANDGSLWAWGVGTQYGALGENATAVRSSPISVVGEHSFNEIAAGYANSYALKANDGSLWTWGYGSGKADDDSVNNKSSPVLAVGGHSFTKLSSGGNAFGFALKTEGSAWGWGVNSSGCLGDGTSSTNRSSPTSVVGNHFFSEISAGEAHAVGIKKQDGTCWSWGDNTSGQVGDGSIANRSSPVSVLGNHLFIKVRGTDLNSYGLKHTGEVWSWGSRTNGRIGDGIGSFAMSPIQVVGSHVFYKIANGYSHSIALKSADGSCWVWGAGTATGDSTSTIRSSPISVIGNHSFNTIAGGDNVSVALKANDGSCWTWGSASAGKLGDGTTTNKSSAVSVIGNHSFNQIAAGGGQIIALKANNGTAWNWGIGTSGELGEGSAAVSRSSPVSVVGDHSFDKIAASDGTSFGLKANNGTVWAWGIAAGGILGDGQIAATRSSPVSVVGDHSFNYIFAGNAYIIALKSVDGSAWTWGNNTGGQLGDNTVANRSSPVSVVGAHSFSKAVTARGLSSSGHTIALKANDGSCWAWGDNTKGELGDGTIIDRSSPISVIGGHSFIDIAAGYEASFGLKADGQIWSWGTREVGQLGDNLANYAASPIRIL